MSERNNKNPLKFLWNLLSLIGGVIGLSSLAEKWISDLIKWKSWIEGLVVSYREIVYPIVDFCLGWLPWAIPNLLIDYIFLGLMFITSLSKGLSSNENVSFKEIIRETKNFRLYCCFILLFISNSDMANIISNNYSKLCCRTYN